MATGKGGETSQWALAVVAFCQCRGVSLSVQWCPNIAGPMDKAFKTGKLRGPSALSKTVLKSKKKCS